MDESSPSSEEVIEDEVDEFDAGGGHMIRIACDDHTEAAQVLETVGNQQSDAGHQGFRIDGNDHENDGDQLFEMEGDNEDYGASMLEAEGEDCEKDWEQHHEFESNSHENSDGQVLQMANGIQKNGQEYSLTSVDEQCSAAQENYCPPPVVGMQFESYDDAYNYYNSYAKELGFAVRVKSSWTKRNSKEKRGAVLCCNCEGFKIIKEACTRRKETRTGCLAMIRLRLVESNRWRADEVKLEHNHLFNPERVQNSNLQKMEAGVKRKPAPAFDVEVRTIKLYQMPAVGASGSRSFDSNGNDDCSFSQTRHLKLDNRDVEAIHDYVSRAQLMNPNFVYLIDMNDEGQLRNIFWIDSRSRAAYTYFGDVVAVDTTCLSKKYKVPLLTFVGLNHHGQSVLLGCGLLVDETIETYIWLFRTWLTCIKGRPPQTIVTDHCKAVQVAIAEVFPRAHHCVFLSVVMQSMLQKLCLVQDSASLGSLLRRTVYESQKVDEFEVAWENMVHHFGIRDHKWLQSLYDVREQWAPVYLKDTFLAGLFATQTVGSNILFFDGCIHEHTSMKEFFDMYGKIIKEKRVREACDDLESRDLNHLLRTRCSYERQLSKVYTREIFEKFQREVEMMPSCMGISEVHASGQVITYMLKEHTGGSLREFRNFEVTYDKSTAEVRCLCGCFYLNGYLCRHALSVFNYNGVEEIPFPYILSRWRKDCERLYVPDFGSNTVDITNPGQWYDHLYRRAISAVEEGMMSQDHYMAAWQAFKESLNKVRHTVVSQGGSTDPLSSWTVGLFSPQAAVHE